MSDEKSLKTMFLTCWVEYITQEELKLKCEFLEYDNLIIGAIENTENEKQHFHALINLKHSKRFNTLKSIFGDSTHIEKVGKISNAYEYVKKEGCFFNSFDDYIPPIDVWSCIVNDINFGLSFKEICERYPKFCIIHFDNLLKFYSTLREKNL